MAKRLMYFTFALVFLIPSISMGKDMAKRWGLGYYNTEAPLGVRVWLSPKVGLDLGVGVETTDLGDSTAMNLAVEVGVPFIVYPTERANFFVRPGVLFESIDARSIGFGFDDKFTVIEPSLSLGAEVFFGDHFSLEASQGISMTNVSEPDTLGGESTTEFHSFGQSVTDIGFHFYFH